MDGSTLNPPADDRQEIEPDLRPIVDALEPRLGACERSPRPLEGGITNRNYRAGFGGREYVLRVPGRETELLAIDRRAEAAANRLAAKLGIAPPVAAVLERPPCLVTDFIQGEALEPEALRAPAALGRVAEILRRLHRSGAELPVAFSAFRMVERYRETAAARGATIPPAYEPAAEAAAAIEAGLAPRAHPQVPCHDDLLAANLIDAGERLWLVDWEYAGIGDPWFDLANFAVNNGLDAEHERTLLRAYLGTDPDAGELSSLRLMRVMSDFREAMWGVVQGAISGLDFDFGAYAQRHFERLAAAVADPSFERRLADAAV